MDMEADPNQQRVLNHQRGALLAAGPPGSGKTTLLRERFARLVEGGEDPERVALFVLDRKAAAEAREAIMRRLRNSLPALPVTTVHGFAFRFAGRRFEKLGFADPPRVLSAPEQYGAVRDLLAKERAEDWPRYGHLLEVRGFVRQVADFVLRAQERLLSPEELEALVDRGGRAGDREIADFYRRYLDRLREAGQADFSGLLHQTVSLLRREGPGGEAYRHVLIDDYHDTTFAAEGILEALAKAAESVVVAADPAGHVFGYRGGSLEPLRRIDETIGLQDRVSLETSYRLGSATSALLPLDDPEAEPAKPSERFDARLFAHPGEEADGVAHELLRWRVDNDVPWERMVVLMRRYRGYLTAVRHALARHAIPFVVIADESAIAQEPATALVIDLFRYAFRPETRDGLLEGLLSSPVGGLAPHGVRRLRREARTRGVPILQLVEEGGLEGLEPDLAEPVRRFRELVGDLPEVARRAGPDGAFYEVWRRVPGLHGLAEHGKEAEGDLDALAALGNVLRRFVERRPGATIEDYLDTIEAAEFDPDPAIGPEERGARGVRIISAHRAQGQEFDVVLVVGCLEGEFPSLDHLVPDVDLERLIEPRTPAELLRVRLAEERALFRLACSRATRATVLFASHSQSVRNPRTPSRFAARLGLEWVPEEQRAAQRPAAITSLRSMEAELRRRLADPLAPAPSRLAALAALPAAGADPSAWWGAGDWTDSGAPLHEGELRTSYSRLSVLQNCGLQYLFNVEMGLDPDPTHQMWLGSIVHDIIDAAQRGDIELSEKALIAALEERWDPLRFPNRAVEHRRRKDAEGMLSRWFEHETHDPLRSEVKFAFPIDGALLTGKIDAIFQMGGGTRVVDYKTARWVPTKDEVQKDLQLATYYLAVKKDEELRKLGRPRYLQLHFLGKANQREGYARRDVTPGKVDGYDEWAEKTLRELLERVRAEDFSPSPEANCQWCDFKTICPIWPEGREAPR
ncbi:MAG: ATP-dependent helicase [Actinomycetota bacterium]